MKRKIVGLFGLPTAGKSYAASVLTKLDPSFQVVSFASPIKGMLAAINGGQPLDKAKTYPLLGNKTGRELCQTLGTEWGRELVSPTLWVDLMAHAVGQLPEGCNVVFDDLRFNNEQEYIRGCGGKIVHISAGTPLEEVPAHASEVDWRDWTPDYALDNRARDYHIFRDVVEMLDTLFS